MVEIIVKTKEGDIIINLNEPNFEVYGMAIMAGKTSVGLNPVDAGRFVIETCVINREILDVLSKNAKAFATASLQAYNLLDLYDSELKKK